MKRLILIRHGHSIRLSGQTDFERSLTETGYKEAQKAADFLIAKQYLIDALYSSPADRTLETARIIFDQDENIDEIEIKEERYNCNEEIFLNVIKNADKNLNCIIIIGHNPAITSIVAKFKITEGRQRLIKALNYDVTCKVVVIEINTNNWSGIENANTNLVEVFYP